MLGKPKHQLCVTCAALSKIRTAKRLSLLVIGTMWPAIALFSQSFKTLYSFGPNSGHPASGVILISNTLYGTGNGYPNSTGGGSSGGDVYSVNIDGTKPQVVFSFDQAQSHPRGAFVISGDMLYTTGDSGAADGGSIIEVPIDGSSQSYSNWYDFVSAFSDGRGPEGVILSDSVLYGVTRYGGKSGQGTVYSYDGSTATYLYSFSGTDGATPSGSLVLYNGTLFGVTYSGGNWGNGTIYTIKADGSGFTILHHFSASTNGEGANPLSGLILWGNTLFGTTSSGGSFGLGTVFSIGTNGTGFATLHNFGGTDGSKPEAALNLSLNLFGNTLYGTTAYGGPWDSGTVFALGTDGSEFTTLHSFNGGDGASPVAKMLLSSNTLYGTTFNGGSGRGTVFSLWLGVPRPQLAITPSGPSVVLTWPTNGSFFLQSATNLFPAAAWTKVATGPVVVGGLNTVTDSISKAQRLYRLSE